MTDMLLIEMTYDEFMNCWYNKNEEQRKTIAQNAKTIKKLNGEKRRLLNKVKRLKKVISQLKEEYYTNLGAMKSDDEPNESVQTKEETVQTKEESDKNKPEIEIAEIIYDDSEGESKNVEESGDGN